MADLKWIEVFKGGTRTSSNGVTRTYTPEELDQAVETYNPSHFKAPLIVSYPAHNTAGFSDRELHKSQLAFGFPEQLKRAGDKLLAGFKKISPKVREWINNGEILGFSSSFYLPNSPHNPYPGKLALRHIAGCGVDPPAVKGMESPEFGEPLSAFVNYAEDQEGSVEFSLDVDDQTLKDAQLGVKVYRALRAVDQSVTSFMMGGEAGAYFLDTAIAHVFRDFYRRMRDRHIEDKGIEEADKLFPPYDLEQLSNIVSRPSPMLVTWDDFRRLEQRLDALQMGAIETSSYQEDEPVPDEKLEAQFSELQNENKALRDRIAAVEAERERERVTNFVENAIRDRKIYPNERDAEIRDILALNHTETADYGEAGQLTARQRYMQKIGDRKPLWNSNNKLPIGPGDAPEADYSEAANFGEDVDPESLKHDRQIRAKATEMGKDPNNALHYAEAMSALGIRY